ncbi:MAG: O-antigen ligase family protein [candidate division FCPU426 bacterium]
MGQGLRGALTRLTPVFGNLGLGMIGLLLPLVFYTRAEDAYHLPQLLALSVALVALGIDWCRCPVSSQARKIQGVVFAFFLWRLVTHINAGWRLEWVLEQSLYAAAFFWASRGLGHGDKAGRLIATLLTGACIAALYGILQSLGLDPLDPGRSAGFGARAHATLGNPDFWGGYLVLVLPFALDGALKRWRGLPVFFLLFAGLVLSQTRAAWLAFGVSALLLTALRVRGQDFKAARLAVLSLGCLSVVLLFSFSNPLNPSGMKSLGRLASITDLKGEGAQGRFFLSKVAGRIALRHPVKGTGAGHYTDAYLREQGVLLASPEHKGQPYRFTRDAHNDWLQLAAESGVLAPLLLALAIFLALRATRSAALATALIAFSLNAWLAFPLAIVPSAALFWILMGFAAAQSSESVVDHAEEEDRRGFWLPQGLLLVASLAGALFFWRQLSASVLLNRGMNLSLAGRGQQAAPFLLKAGQLRPFDERPWMRLGLNADAAGDLALAETYFSGALQAEPALPEAWSDRALVRAKAGKLAEAREDCVRALELDPRSLAALSTLGNVEYLSGNRDAAISAYQRGLAMDPSWETGRDNLQQILNHPR